MVKSEAIYVTQAFKIRSTIGNFRGGGILRLKDEHVPPCVLPGSPLAVDRCCRPPHPHVVTIHPRLSTPAKDSMRVSQTSQEQVALIAELEGRDDGVPK